MDEEKTRVEVSASGVLALTTVTMVVLALVFLMGLVAGMLRYAPKAPTLTPNPVSYEYCHLDQVFGSNLMIRAYHPGLLVKNPDSYDQSTGYWTLQFPLWTGVQEQWGVTEARQVSCTLHWFYVPVDNDTIVYAEIVLTNRETGEETNPTRFYMGRLLGW